MFKEVILHSKPKERGKKASKARLENEGLIVLGFSYMQLTHNHNERLLLQRHA